MIDPGLARYFKDISNYKPISREEEIRLARKARNGDEAAREKLILANLRFVVQVAKNFQNQGLSLLELIIAGNYGLVKAASNYDERRKVRFLTYAVWWIRKEIQSAIRDHQIMKVDWSEKDRKMDRAIKRLYKQLGREPSIDEIARELSIPPDEISAPPLVQMDRIDDEGFDQSSLAEEITIPSPEEIFLKKRDQELINEALKRLNKTEATVIKRNYGLDGNEPESMEKIGKRLRLSRERVRQIRNRALNKLRAYLEEKGTYPK
ncbi:RNA polymerase subunit sigma [candidate division WOR-3 bacterium]|uniref:RNA polymerase subunit sigma n=1 Tax=candidate division WOR-3 bacterium TaxID=2052148 RepID=A0A660SIM9_UNCW3|nr:MAG: RNA polymerase subunit sigma [candidate division WOR-3 bacterium]